MVVIRKLTKRVVDASTAKAGRFIVWDAELKGFGLLVTLLSRFRVARVN
jgi:hypothetical protein